MKRNGLRFGKLTFNQKPIHVAILSPAALLIVSIFIAYFSHAIYPLPENIIIISRTISFVLITLLIAGILSKIVVSSMLKGFKDSPEPEQKILAGKLYVALIYAMAMIIVFWQLGITLQNIALFLTLFATGLAFAIRDIIISYMAWYVLLTKKPFRIGDHIRIDEYEGKVEHIGTFYVILDEYPESYEDYVRVPNKIFLEKPIRVYGKESYESTIEYPLPSINETLEEATEKAENMIEESLGKKFSIHINSTREKQYLSVTYKSAYKDRNHARSKIIRILSKCFS
jgi:MscS family membrane protein